jgi:hypothetical protein
MFRESILCQGTTSQAAEKLLRESEKCQGTASAVPQYSKMNGALAPEEMQIRPGYQRFESLSAAFSVVPKRAGRTKGFNP